MCLLGLSCGQLWRQEIGTGAYYRLCSCGQEPRLAFCLSPGSPLQSQFLKLFLEHEIEKKDHQSSSIPGTLDMLLSPSARLWEHTHDGAEEGWHGEFREMAAGSL